LMQKKKLRKHPDRQISRFEVSSYASRTVIRSLSINKAISLTFIDRATLLIDWQLGWCVIFRDTPIGILKADKCGKVNHLNVNVT
jgi:hypothetical protein